ncbi:hypothetical protein C6B38_02920 [Spiroplasma sp. ChiS]|uniref:hypothetical protein n=1 Tax=Spiroplasma sp. ChiS TaxID=2099885 RepID=UPI000CF872B7|nr:hypothetical protein [Spiroplasma sp. ChiS]PQP78978.1 hypothetical protein C6B38_02920 [Spiroplasma sp. ChiS]
MLIDAGSIGINDLDNFYQIAKEYQTPIRSLLNVSAIGLSKQNELSNSAYLLLDEYLETIKKYQDFIIGAKIRLSSSVVGDTGVNSLVRFNQARLKISRHFPLMVHLGNTPPHFASIINNLTRGDIITHVFHQKNYEIFNAKGAPTVATLNAKNQGIYFDLEHGSESFSYLRAEKVFNKKIDY